MLKQLFEQNECITKKLFKSIVSTSVLVIVVSLFVVSLLVFTINNTHEQIWYDEALSMYITDLPLPEMIHTISNSGAEANPPLFHIFLKVAKILFGNSLFISRCLSGFLGSIFIVLFYLFVQRIFSKPAALISSSMLIFNPIIIHYSQDIRMYMLATLLLCISQFSFYIAVTEGKKIFWILYTVSCIACIYTHNYLLFPLAANFAFFIVMIIHSLKKSSRNSQSIIFYAVSQLIILLSYIPWAPSLLQQSSQMLSAQWTEPATADVLYKILAYFHTTKFSLDINPLFPYQTMVTLELFFVSLLLYHRFKNRVFDEKIVFLFTTVFIPVSLVFIYSSFRHSIIIFRHFIPYFPFFIILVVSGILLIGKKQIILMISLLFITANIPTVYYIYTKNFNGSARETAEFIRDKNKSGDPVITFENSSFLTLYYYLNKPSYLHYYSDEVVPACFGANLYPDQMTSGGNLNKILEGKKNLYMVLTPWTKEYPKAYLQNIISGYSTDSTFDKKFIYDNSWFRTKTVKYSKNE